MAGILYRKTPLGEEEIARRSLNLPVRLRSVLITVDGKKSSQELAKNLAAMGDVAAMLSELEQKGCIERFGEVAAAAPPAGPPAALKEEARQYAVDYVYNLLGPDSESLVRRIEKCKTAQDLSAVVEECRVLIASVGQGKKAEEFSAKVKELMSS